MVESVSLTKNWENHWVHKSDPIPLKKEKKNVNSGLEVDVINHAILNKEHRIIKRNASYFPPVQSDNFTIPHIPIPVLYPVCENEKSCFGRCTNGRTEWKTQTELTCSCDPDCYEIFNDCCSDYVKYCGVQKPQNVSSIKQYKWTCQAFGNIDPLQSCTIADGIWMVSGCSYGWPNDTIRTKCEIPLQQLTVSSTDHARYLPVVTQHNITFRNLYCALCNKVNNPSETWPLNIDTVVVPPENYNLTQKIQFLLSYGAKVRNKGPKTSQPRRYCLTEQFVDTCASDQPSASCGNGPTAIVWAGKNLKNLYCAFCNGLRLNDTSCFPVVNSRRCAFFTPQSFSLVLDSQRRSDDSESEFLVAKETCGQQGMIFDDILQVCRISWLNPPDQNGQDRFHVVAWLAPQQFGTTSNDFSAEDFQNSLAEHLNASSNQIFYVNISSILKTDTFSFTFSGAVPVVEFFLVSSTIILTPQQSLELLSIQRNNHATTGQRLVNFIYFKEPFLMNINNQNYTIAKTTSRPLACSGKKLYTSEQYTLLDGGTVYINSTNTTYEKSQYFTRENSQQLNGSALGDNITVCEKYIPTGCKTPWIILEPKQFTILANLSIYDNETSSLYQYGQYDVLSNGSVAVCAHFFEIDKKFKSIREIELLGWITFIGFFLSILFLIFLLVTYMLFPQLQTLPGKNIMNLAATLLFFELLWILPGFDDLRRCDSFCTSVAVLAHYGLLTNFVSMSVIAFHTCKVFARQFPALKYSKSHERKLFILYSMLVWFVPAIFVVILFILDKKEIAYIGYGDSGLCFVGQEDSNMYFITVTIPIAISLFFNIVAFITSVIYLRKHGQNNAALNSSAARRSNIYIYMKLSTLMGFSWLFGFFAYVFETETVFWYLFVILTSLQGVFITVAFVFNGKTLTLYHRYTHTSQKTSIPETTSRNLTRINRQDTKL